MTKSTLALTGAFFFAFVFFGFVPESSAKYLDEDFSNLPTSRTLASVEPADLAPSIHSGERAPALYELGIGMGGGLDPHYPGSDQSRVILLPFPYGVYRGKVVQSDRKGTRAKLITGKDYELTLSGSGAFPVKSSDDTARMGMEDLGWMLQLGPKIRLELKSWADGSVLRAGVSARAAFSANGLNSVASRGWVFEPEIVYQKPDAFAERFDFFSSLSATFATSNYMDYLYGVRFGDVTALRPEYSSQAGYLESVLQVGASYRTLDGMHKFFLSTQLGSLDGAANNGSPLVRTKSELTIAVAWVWTLFESEEKAVSSD
jgi:outer membrane protein